MGEKLDTALIFITLLAPVLGSLIGFGTGRLWLVAWGWIIMFAGLWIMVATMDDSQQELLDYLRLSEFSKEDNMILCQIGLHNWNERDDGFERVCRGCERIEHQWEGGWVHVSERFQVRASEVNPEQ